MTLLNIREKPYHLSISEHCKSDDGAYHFPCHFVMKVIFYPQKEEAIIARLIIPRASTGLSNQFIYHRITKNLCISIFHPIFFIFFFSLVLCPSYISSHHPSLQFVTTVNESLFFLLDSPSLCSVNVLASEKALFYSSAAVVEEVRCFYLC